MGPLSGTRVLEIGGIGPVPFCGMLFADFGADVVLIERPARPDVQAQVSRSRAFYKRGKKSVTLNLKKPEAIHAVLCLLDEADILIEGFRPGVMERLGLGPDTCLARNPRLVYGRQTGWGQTGPLAQAAGHDINFIALAGALYYTGHGREAPFTPPTVVGDVGGGALLLSVGILAALQHSRNTGRGQVVDAAVTDGTVYMMTLLETMRETGYFGEPRGATLFSGGAPWYRAFECADGEFVTIGALEPQFYRLLLKECGLLDDPDFAGQFSKEDWPRALAKLERLFKTRTRAEWCERLEGTDVCFAPVLSMPEARQHPHNVARANFVDIDGVVQPAPAPKLADTPAWAGSIPELGEHTEQILSELGFSKSDLELISHD